MIPRAAADSAVRTCVVMADCVVQEAARAAGTKTPKHATKHKGSANCPFLYLKNITAAFPTGF
jgi:hypothetical protein